LNLFILFSKDKIEMRSGPGYISFHLLEEERTMKNNKNTVLCSETLRKMREEYGYDNGAWSDQTINIDYVTPPPAPCSAFYTTADVKEIDLDCWQNIRGGVQKTLNAISSSSQTSCINTSCGDPTSYGDTNIPPFSKLCPWVQCVAKNCASTDSTLVQSVFGSTTPNTNISCNNVSVLSSTLPSSSPIPPLPSLPSLPST